MKIFSAAQIREADEFTIKYEPIRSIKLMERASKAFVDWFELNFERNRHVYIFCGTGNNGGDGMAISRMLSFKKWKVDTYTIQKSSKRSQDFTINYLKLAEVRDVDDISGSGDLNMKIGENDIIIDAIFGSGLTRPVTGMHAEVIDFINNSSATVVSVDVPSGLFIDSPTTDGAVVFADYVLSFQLPKLAFFMQENHEYVKNWSTADIGLHPNYLNNTAAKYEYVDKDYAKGIIRERSKFAHKGDFGKSMIISGSFGKMGAAVLCARACMKSGAGLVTAHVPGCGYQIMQTSIPEVMVTTDFGERFLTGLPDIKHYDAIGIGPGIEKHIDTYEVISQLLSRYNRPIVFDADAINIISLEKSFLRMLPEGSILTPHPGEFRRLTGQWNNDFEKLEKQIALSEKFKVFIVLKGANTSVSTPDGKIFFNSTGNPGMATGGSGDVLTGMITSFLGQGYVPREAAVLAVYLHGLAGDIAADFLGHECLMASDIIDYLPQAFMELKD
jgi:NAD(P)H-hydrate epimerase